VPGVLLLLYAKYWKRLFPAYSMRFWISIAALAAIILVDFATTAVDRVSLYLTPLQVAVFARLPIVMRNQFAPQVVRLGIITEHAMVLFVWLNYAIHALYWLPYRSLLFL